MLKEKIDLLMRRLFGSKSEKLDAAQLELLLKEDALGKADASPEKEEASPNFRTSKPVAKRSEKNQRRERWPKDLAVQQEVIEPAEVRDNPEAFRCIGEDVTEMLDYQPAKFFATPLVQLIVSKYCDHLPLFRQEQIYWNRHQVWLPRQSMAQWVQLASEWLNPIYPADQRPDDERLLPPGR